MYGPMMFMIAANVVMFVWSTVSFYRSSVDLQVTNVTRKSKRYKQFVDKIIYIQSFSVFTLSANNKSIDVDLK
jgi:hypothetical protein